VRTISILISEAEATGPGWGSSAFYRNRWVIPGRPCRTICSVICRPATAGQGTLCGALGVASQYLRMVAYDEDKTHVKMIDELFQWYSRTDFPTQRFDDICHFPNQVKRNAKTPLCHVSVSQWTLAAGAKVTSKEKKDRCAKVTGEVIYQTVSMLNLYAEGRYQPRHTRLRKRIRVA
jgi:hypothetical protein